MYKIYKKKKTRKPLKKLGHITHHREGKQYQNSMSVLLIHSSYAITGIKTELWKYNLWTWID